MTDELISFETAKLAREKGFDERCVKLYNTLGELWDCHYSYVVNSDMDHGGRAAACTQSLLQKWLREVHDIHVNTSSRYNPPKLEDKVFYSYDISTKNNRYAGIDENLETWLGWNQENNIPILMYHTFNTYEEALEQGLIEALKLINNK